MTWVHIDRQNRDEKNNSHRQCHRNTLVTFVILILCIIIQQLVSVLACRSIDILSEVRFIYMIISQIFGFPVCLLCVFLLGTKYALLKGVW
jgi:putative flippase GtrA